MSPDSPLQRIDDTVVATPSDAWIGCSCLELNDARWWQDNQMHDMDGRSDEELLEAARAGDIYAHSLLYGRWKSKFIDLATRRWLRGDWFDAEEVYDDAFEEAFRSFDRAQRTSFKTHLGNLIRKRAIDKYRRRSKTPGPATDPDDSQARTDPLVSPLAEVEEDAIAHELARDVQTVVEKVWSEWRTLGERAVVAAWVLAKFDILGTTGIEAHAILRQYGVPPEVSLLEVGRRLRLQDPRNQVYRWRERFLGRLKELFNDALGEDDND
jgi:DNA-directed RNA polymerase specialized sigma24 family protein